ncbi:hypothetical protein THASP1DRAFT_26932, partial [Thamnocephalis sphaerospora]
MKHIPEELFDYLISVSDEAALVVLSCTSWYWRERVSSRQAWWRWRFAQQFSLQDARERKWLRLHPVWSLEQLCWDGVEAKHTKIVEAWQGEYLVLGTRCNKHGTSVVSVLNVYENWLVCQQAPSEDSEPPTHRLYSAATQRDEEDEYDEPDPMETPSLVLLQISSDALNVSLEEKWSSDVKAAKVWPIISRNMLCVDHKDATQTLLNLADGSVVHRVLLRCWYY